MGPQLSLAVKDFARETAFQSLWDVWVDTFANTLVKELFGKEFIPRFPVKSTGPQLSSVVKHFARETEFQSLWEVLVDTFTNTFVNELFGTEFIPRFDIICDPFL